MPAPCQKMACQETYISTGWCSDIVPGGPQGHTRMPAHVQRLIPGASNFEPLRSQTSLVSLNERAAFLLTILHNTLIANLARVGAGTADLA